jgi:pimeloyl-ACP methyl ester carboxylesterase
LTEPVTAENVEASLTRLAILTHSEPGTQYLVEQRGRIGRSLPLETVLNFLDPPPDPDRDVAPLLPEVSVPTLVMRGTADRLGSAEGDQYLLDHIKGAQFYSFQGRSHALLATATTEFCEVLRRFLRTGSVPAADHSA